MLKRHDRKLRKIFAEIFQNFPARSVSLFIVLASWRWDKATSRNVGRECTKKIKNGPMLSQSCLKINPKFYQSCLRLVSQKTLCNGAIKIVSQVSPNFGCLFLRNNAVFLTGGMAIGWRDEYVVIIFQFFLNIIDYLNKNGHILPTGQYMAMHGIAWYCMILHGIAL